MALACTHGPVHGAPGHAKRRKPTAFTAMDLTGEPPFVPGAHLSFFPLGVATTGSSARMICFVAVQSQRALILPSERRLVLALLSYCTPAAVRCRRGWPKCQLPLLMRWCGRAGLHLQALSNFRKTYPNGVDFVAAISLGLLLKGN